MQNLATTEGGKATRVNVRARFDNGRESALPYVTFYSGRAEINVLDAAPTVVAALPGMNPSRLGARAASEQNSTLTFVLHNPDRPALARTFGAGRYEACGHKCNGQHPSHPAAVEPALSFVQCSKRNARPPVRGRSPALRPADHELVPSGSPVLEGATVTVAGAALLRRVSEAVTRVDGNVLSSQVDLQGAQAKSGLIAVIISCEVDQPALQRLLYDLEAGMPFLFIDQLSAQARSARQARRSHLCARPSTSPRTFPLPGHRQHDAHAAFRPGRGRDGRAAVARAAVPTDLEPVETDTVPAAPIDVGADAPVGPKPLAAEPADATASTPPPNLHPAPSGNPLWAVPLKQLSATRERPIFSPSRRPPQTAVAAAPYVPPPAPPKPVELPRPQLSLVGTISGEVEGFGIFLEQVGDKVLRLKTGETHKGWTLLEVRARQIVLQKDNETITLSLPAPGSVQTTASTRADTDSPPASPSQPSSTNRRHDR
jgi:general secretion pathway protein N